MSGDYHSYLAAEISNLYKSGNICKSYVGCNWGTIVTY